jgi:[ribosomal protein S5]-alanine N-acetyltransferase
MNIIETERLILRKFSSDDWKDLYEYLSQESVVKYEPYEVFTEDKCKESAIKRSQNDAFWAVCLKDNNKLIGNVYFEQQEPEEFLTWEIGYVFNPSYYGKGYATESCKGILNYAFEQLNARRIVAMCNPKNTASWKLLERLNMKREGHLKKNIFFKYDKEQQPIWNDTYEYALLKDDWLNMER